jgi:cytoskeletal protein RodZ
MDSSVRAPGYDLFKLIVAIILLLIFICLLFWTPANTPQPETPTSTPPVWTETHPANETPTSAPPTELPLPSPTATSSTLTATPPPPPSPTATETSSGTITATPPVLIPSPTASVQPSPTQIFTPTSTGTPVSEATATQIVGTPSGTYTCESALSRSRLQVGGNAMILRRLNFRSSPGIQNNWLQTNLPGTQVEVLDGPTCLPHFIGAYVWWQIRLPDGQVGWSAEISLLGRFYFIEPR